MAGGDARPQGRAGENQWVLDVKEGGGAWIVKFEKVLDLQNTPHKGQDDLLSPPRHWIYLALPRRLFESDHPALSWKPPASPESIQRF